MGGLVMDACLEESHWLPVLWLLVYGRNPVDRSTPTGPHPMAGQNHSEVDKAIMVHEFAWTSISFKKLNQNNLKH